MQRTFDYQETAIDMDTIEDRDDCSTNTSKEQISLLLNRLDRFETYFDEAEKMRFQSMCQFMQEFAFEQSALLTITETETDGTFLLDAPRLCFLDSLNNDRDFLQYLEKNVAFIEPSEIGVRLEIHVPFRKKREKKYS